MSGRVWQRWWYPGMRWTPETLETPARDRERAKEREILRDRLAQVQFEQLDAQLRIVKERLDALERWRASEAEIWGGDTMTLNDRLWSLSVEWEQRAGEDRRAAAGKTDPLSEIQKAWAQARRNDAAQLRMILREYATKNPAMAGSFAPSHADRESA